MVNRFHQIRVNKLDMKRSKKYYSKKILKWEDKLKRSKKTDFIASELQNVVSKALRPFQSRKMVFFMTDFITGAPSTLPPPTKKEKTIKKIYASWPVQRDNGSNAATQGDGIWDRPDSRRILSDPTTWIRTFFVTFYFGICKHWNINLPQFFM